MLGRAWWGALAALVAIRVAIPLAALAVSGSALPGLPRFDYVGLSGDATGYYAAIREFISATAKLSAPLLGFLAIAAAGLGAVLVLAVRRRALALHWALAAAALAVSLVVALAVSRMTIEGAGAFGWPLVWSIPLFPLRALGMLDQDVAFGFGLVLSLAANVVTLVAIALIGLRVTGRRWPGLAAAALYALWPLLVEVVAGERGWENGSWNVDVGLHMYTEPLSTALVTSALALLLSPAATPLRLTLAGVVVSLGTLVRISNGILAAVVLMILVWRFGARRSLPFLAGGLTFAPAVIAYWSHGYVVSSDSPAGAPLFALGYAGRNWLDSLLFSPRTLAVLVPLAVVGALAIRSRYALALLVLPVLANAAFYTFYASTAQHPRFLYVSLPAVFVLWAAGAAWVVLGLRKAWLRRRESVTMMTP